MSVHLLFSHSVCVPTYWCLDTKELPSIFITICMRTQRVRYLGSVSEEKIFSIAAIKKKIVIIILLQKVERKSWLEISLINGTDITLKFISWTQSGMLIIQLRMIFSISYDHVE